MLTTLLWIVRDTPWIVQGPDTIVTVVHRRHYFARVYVFALAICSVLYRDLPVEAFSSVPVPASSLLHFQTPWRELVATTSSICPSWRCRARASKSCTSLRSLVPLETDELNQLLALGAPTAAQYSTYFGRTSTERYARFVEGAIVSFLGVFFSYFLSFVLGGWVATVCGTLFLFWGVLSPEFKARQRNWEFLGGRPLVDPLVKDDDWSFGDRDDASLRQQAAAQQQGLYGALFLGVVEDACVVQNAEDAVEYGLEEFADYRMEHDELERFTGSPWLLRVKCIDSTGRQLQFNARLSEEYLDIAVGAGVVGILLSKSPDFTTLAAITDLYCPSAECWIGDYPYLDRAETERLLAENNSIWDSFVLEEETASRARNSLDDEPQTEEEYRLLT
jgi:hypothetical protein